MKKLIACTIVLCVSLSVSAQSVEPSVCGSSPCSSGIEALYRFAEQPLKPSLGSAGAGAAAGFLAPVTFATGIYALAHYWHDVQLAALSAYTQCVMNCAKLKEWFDFAMDSWSFMKWMTHKIGKGLKIMSPEQKKILKTCIASMDNEIKNGVLSLSSGEKGKTRCKVLYGYVP